MNDELHDPQIASMLGRASGAYPDANVAYVAVSGRVRQAKRRRAFAAGTAACAMVLGVAGVAAQAGGSGSQLTPAGTLTTPSVSASVSTVEDTVTTMVDTSATVEGTATSVETTTADTATTIAGAGSGVGGSPGTSTSNSGHGGSTSTSGTTSNSSGSSTKPTVPAGPQTAQSAGGSLAFSNDGGTLTFVTATPTAGFDEDTNARVVESHRLRVEFTDGNTTWRIEVRTEGGKMPIEVTQHG